MSTFRLLLATSTFVLAGIGALALSSHAAAPAIAPQSAVTAPAAATLPPDEKQAGFRLLFDGITTTGWRQLGGMSFPPAGWDINDGALHHKPNGGGGDITPDALFESFELRFDFKVATDANSGLKYRVVEVPNNHAALGIEYQVVDALSAKADNKHKHSLGSLYDLVEAKVENPKKPGEWNQARIIVQGNHFEHWLNGVKLAELDYGTDAWKAAFAASKWAQSNPDFASVPKAHIALQDHMDEVWFKNIRIKELNAK